MAHPNNMVACCLYGSRVSGYAREDSDYDVLLIIDRYKAGVKYNYLSADGAQLAILAVDKSLFESDINEASLGEFVAGRLLTPYEPLINQSYLAQMEVSLKKRTVLESLENIILQYSDSACELLIKPEYFMYKKMSTRARIYPLAQYSYFNIFKKDLKAENTRKIMEGYNAALRQLAEEGIVEFENGFVKIMEHHVKSRSEKKLGILNIINALSRAAKSYIVHGYAGQVSPLMVAQEIFSKIKRDLNSSSKPSEELEEPEKYIFVSTDAGVLPLKFSGTIESILEKFEGKPIQNLRYKKIGGVLNSVYEIDYIHDGHLRRFVAKHFGDWYGLKWFPLAIWTLGVTNFDITARGRMANEFSINRFLKRRGFDVPEIIYLDWGNTVIIRAFVDGKNLDDFLRHQGEHLSPEATEALFKTGEAIAKVHKSGVILGDCKDENIVLNDNRVFFVDLEQAHKRGDQAWDIAEFLYYSGRFQLSTTKIHDISENFLKGYLSIGDVNNVKRITSAKYTSLFLPITPIHVVNEITKVCNALI